MSIEHPRIELVSAFRSPGNAAPRQAHEFDRTTCACSLCQIPCRQNPGGLDIGDLLALCPPGQDVFAWGEDHLRALVGRRYPALVPARRDDGACHWYFQGKCAVHENAPYGCAFFDLHMTGEEVDRRYAALVEARQADAQANGLYTRVWRHLCEKGLIAGPGRTRELTAEIHRIQRATARAAARTGHPSCP